MYKNKNFWIGFLVGYFLVALVPQANVVKMVKKG